MNSSSNKKANHSEYLFIEQYAHRRRETTARTMSDSQEHPQVDADDSADVDGSAPLWSVAQPIPSLLDGAHSLSPRAHSWNFVRSPLTPPSILLDDVPLSTL